MAQVNEIWDHTRLCHVKWECHDDVIKWKHFPRNWPFVTGEFPAQRWVMQSFDVFFDLSLNKRLRLVIWDAVVVITKSM